MNKNIKLNFWDKIIFDTDIEIYWQDWYDNVEWEYIVLNVDKLELFFIDDDNSIKHDIDDWVSVAIKKWIKEWTLRIQRIKDTEANSINLEKLLSLYNEYFNNTNSNRLYDIEYHMDLYNLYTQLQY